MLKTYLSKVLENAEHLSSLLYAVIDTLIPQIDYWSKLNCVNTALFAAWKNNVLDKQPKEILEYFANSLGRTSNITVEEVEIKSLADLPAESLAAVEFEFNRETTWIYVKDRFMAYNPVEQNKPFQYGKPIKAEIIKIERIV